MRIRLAALVAVWAGLLLFSVALTLPYAIGDRGSSDFLAWISTHPDRPSDPEARARWTAEVLPEWTRTRRAQTMGQKPLLIGIAATLTGVIGLAPVFVPMGGLGSRRRHVGWFAIAGGAGAVAAAVLAVVMAMRFFDSMTEVTAPFARGALASVPIAAGIGLVVGLVTAWLLEFGRRFRVVAFAGITAMWVVAIGTFFAARAGSLESLRDLREGMLVDLLHGGSSVLLLVVVPSALACRRRGCVPWQAATITLCTAGSLAAVATFAAIGSVAGWHRLVPGLVGAAVAWLSVVLWRLSSGGSRVG